MVLLVVVGVHCSGCLVNEDKQKTSIVVTSFLITYNGKKIYQSTTKITEKVTKLWQSDVEDTIKGYLVCTNWYMFLDSSDTADESADVISEYINFYVD